MTISELFAGNIQLASSPEIFIRLTAIIDDPEKSLTDAAKVIEHDPGITARLLKVVNSAFYGLPSKLFSVQQAISLLGYQEVRDIVLATVVIERFASMPTNLISMRDFWGMSVRTAIIAKLLAAQHPDKKQLGACFVCGLLHDIGRLVIYQRIPDLAQEASLRAHQKNLPEHLAERQVLGFDHYQAGSELAKRWRLPEVIHVTMEFHSNPHEAETYHDETLIVTLAQGLARLGDTEGEAAEGLLSEFAAFWETLKPSDGLLREIINSTDQRFQALFSQLYPS